MGASVGGGKGESGTKAHISPAQTQFLTEQAKQLTNFYFPAYRNVINTAGNVYNKQSEALAGNIGNASNVLGNNQRQLGNYGSQALRTGLGGLNQLFSKDYENEQVKAATQPYQEEASSQNAALAQRYGSAGALGSARSALASQNLQSLNAARQGNVAAGVRSGIAGQRQDVGKYLGNFGTNALAGAAGSAQKLLENTNLPLDQLTKYAGILYGTPQQNLGPNFTGTQGQSSSGKQSGAGFGVKVPGT